MPGAMLGAAAIRHMALRRVHRLESCPIAILTPCQCACRKTRARPIVFRPCAHWLDMFNQSMAKRW